MQFNTKSNPQKWKRWRINLSFALVGFILIRLVIPLSLIQVSEYSRNLRFHDFFPQFFNNGFLFIVAMDLLLYLQHRAFHQNPLLWRIHRSHHSDCALDASSGLRFHPLELLISFSLKILLVFVLAPPDWSILSSEVLIVTFSLWSHLNIRLPHKLEDRLSYVFVTPVLHLSHHSRNKGIMNHNYASILIFWDKFFFSFLREKQPAIDGIGLSDESDTEALSFRHQLKSPFIKRLS